jgi:hypothetical protein
MLDWAGANIHLAVKDPRGMAASVGMILPRSLASRAMWSHAEPIEVHMDSTLWSGAIISTRQMFRNALHIHIAKESVKAPANFIALQRNFHAARLCDSGAFEKHALLMSRRLPSSIDT